MDASNTGAGTNVQQWTNFNQQNGHWKLIPASTTGLVTLFESCNLSGIHRGFIEGNYTLADMKTNLLPDDFISSVFVPVGYTLEVFQDDNFQGTSLKITGVNNCLDQDGFSNNISSFKIYPSTITGTADITLIDVLVYPNPIRSETLIKGTQEFEKAELYSLNGNLVSTYRQTSFLMEGVASGMYILKIYTNGAIIHKRIVKK